MRPVGDDYLQNSQTSFDFLQETIRALPDDEQTEFVLTRASKASGCSVLLFDNHGELVCAVGEAPAKLIWELLAEARPKITTTVGRWEVRAQRSGPRGGVFTLAFAMKSPGNIEATEPILDATNVAITAVLGIMRGTDVRRMRDISQLLETLVTGISSSREHRYWPRLVEFGFVAHTAFLFVVTESVGRTEPTVDFMADVLDEAARNSVPILLAIRLMSATRDSVVYSIVPDTAESRSWVERSARGQTVGVSLPHSSLTDVPIALREAEMAHRRAVLRAEAQLKISVSPDRISEIVDFSHLGLSAWAATEAPAREFRSRRRKLVSVFDEHPEILETAVRFLAHNMNITETARSLFLHANTVRYRLGRAEELLGGSLRSPMLLADLVLALEPEIRARAVSRQAFDVNHSDV